MCYKLTIKLKFGQISAAGENFANSQARSTRNVNGFTVKYTRF